MSGANSYRASSIAFLSVRVDEGQPWQLPSQLAIAPGRRRCPATRRRRRANAIGAAPCRGPAPRAWAGRRDAGRAASGAARPADRWRRRQRRRLADRLLRSVPAGDRQHPGEPLAVEIQEQLHEFGRRRPRIGIGKGLDFVDQLFNRAICFGPRPSWDMSLSLPLSSNQDLTRRLRFRERRTSAGAALPTFCRRRDTCARRRAGTDRSCGRPA